MKTIHKFVVKATGQILKIPGGLEVLSVTEQHSKVVLYAIVNPEANPQGAPREYEVQAVETGHEIEFGRKAFKFLGTVKLHEGRMMYHMFGRWR